MAVSPWLQTRTQAVLLRLVRLDRPQHRQQRWHLRSTHRPRYIDNTAVPGRADAAASGVGDGAITPDANISEIPGRVLDLQHAIAEDVAKLGFFHQYAAQYPHAKGVMAGADADQFSLRTPSMSLV